MKTFALALAFVFTTAAHAATPAATVNGVAISRSTVDQAVAAATTRGASASPALRQQVRDQLIAEELMWQQAKAAGFDQSTATREAIERTERQTAIARLIAERIKPTEPTEQALRARYADIVSRLGPQEYRLSIIQSANASDVRRAAQQLAAGEPFAHLARQYSAVPSAARGGELDWVSFRTPVQRGQTNGLPIELAQQVTTLEPGQVSGVVSLGDSWAVIRLDAVRATLVPDFDAVRDTLRNAFIAQSIRAQTKAFVVNLMRDAKIQVNE